jgi:hypothetical protein
MRLAAVAAAGVLACRQHSSKKQIGAVDFARNFRNSVSGAPIKALFFKAVERFRQPAR